MKCILLSFNFILIFAINFCTQKPHGTLEVKHVFCNLDGTGDESRFSRKDFYYVYNFTDVDSLRLLAALDTLKIDSSHSNHFHYFYAFDSSMPDTGELAKKMKNFRYNLTDQPGEARHASRRLLVVTFTKSYASEGRVFPSNYETTTYFGGVATTKYFVRMEDSVWKQVPMNAVYPVN